MLVHQAKHIHLELEGWDGTCLGTSESCKTGKHKKAGMLLCVLWFLQTCFNLCNMPAGNLLLLCVIPVKTWCFCV